MKQYPHQEGKNDIEQLLLEYRNLKIGRMHQFLEEDDFIKLIDYFDDAENLTEALTASELGLERYPYSSELMFRKTDILIANRKYLEAIDLLDIAALYDNSNISLYILKTDALLALDRQPEAAAILEAALELFEGEEKIDLLFDLADVYDDYEEFEKVFDCLKIILDVEPNNEEALYKICFWTDFTGRYDESIQLHQNIIDNFPYNEIAWFNLAAAFQGLKLYEKAIDAYQFAVAIDEKFDFAYRNMGDAYLRLRKYKEAIEVLEKVLELARPEDVIYEAIGHCYHRIGNIAQARFNYKKAVHLNNEDAKLHYKLATTYMQEQQWQIAIKHLENALRLGRNSKEINLAMGECKMQIGMFKEASLFFGYIVLHKPSNVAGWEALIKCLIKTENYDDAEERCIAGLKLTNNKPLLLFYYSAVLFAKGKNKEALLQLESAMSLAPKFLKKLLEINPNILLNPLAVEVISRYKKIRKNRK